MKMKNSWRIFKGSKRWAEMRTRGTSCSSDITYKGKTKKVSHECDFILQSKGLNRDEDFRETFYLRVAKSCYLLLVGSAYLLRLGPIIWPLSVFPWEWWYYGWLFVAPGNRFLGRRRTENAIRSPFLPLVRNEITFRPIERIARVRDLSTV